MKTETSSTAEKIAKAARRLLEKGGVEAVTVRSVAAAVGITPMAVYRHYADRDGLLDSLADTGFEELVERLQGKRLKGDVEARVYQLIDVYVEHALGQPRMFELMFLRPRKGARQFPKDFTEGRSPTANFMAAVIEEGVDEGELRKDDVWEMVFEMGALFQGLVMLYVGGRVGMSAGQFRALCKRSFRRYVHGILA
ncbi:MAG: TetR/AcrR family transcriptional regulator [Acidobacteriaceae bacterium]